MTETTTKTTWTFLRRFPSKVQFLWVHSSFPHTDRYCVVRFPCNFAPCTPPTHSIPNETVSPLSLSLTAGAYNVHRPLPLSPPPLPRMCICRTEKQILLMRLLCPVPSSSSTALKCLAQILNHSMRLCAHLTGTDCVFCARGGHSFSQELGEQKIID